MTTDNSEKHEHTESPYSKKKAFYMGYQLILMETGGGTT